MRRASRRRSASRLREARRPHRTRAGRQQGAQARAPVAAGRRPRMRRARHRRRRAEQPRPSDRGAPPHDSGSTRTSCSAVRRATTSAAPAGNVLLDVAARRVDRVRRPSTTTKASSARSRHAATVARRPAADRTRSRSAAHRHPGSPRTPTRQTSCARSDPMSTSCSSPTVRAARMRACSPGSGEHRTACDRRRRRHTPEISQRQSRACREPTSTIGDRPRPRRTRLWPRR